MQNWVCYFLSKSSWKNCCKAAFTKSLLPFLVNTPLKIDLGENPTHSNWPTASKVLKNMAVPYFRVELRVTRVFNHHWFSGIFPCHHRFLVIFSDFYSVSAYGVVQMHHAVWTLSAINHQNLITTNVMKKEVLNWKVFFFNLSNRPDWRSTSDVGSQILLRTCGHWHPT